MIELWTRLTAILVLYEYTYDGDWISWHLFASLVAFAAGPQALREALPEFMRGLNAPAATSPLNMARTTVLTFLLVRTRLLISVLCTLDLQI